MVARSGPRAISEIGPKRNARTENGMLEVNILRREVHRLTTRQPHLVSVGPSEESHQGYRAGICDELRENSEMGSARHAVKVDVLRVPKLGASALLRHGEASRASLEHFLFRGFHHVVRLVELVRQALRLFSRNFFHVFLQVGDVEEGKPNPGLSHHTGFVRKGIVHRDTGAAVRQKPDLAASSEWR